MDSASSNTTAAILTLLLSMITVTASRAAAQGTFTQDPFAQGANATTPPVQSNPADEKSWWDRTKRSIRTTTNVLTMREPLDSDRARQLYQQGDAMFREAAAQQSTSSGDAAIRSRQIKTFEEAAELFQGASEADPDSALGQDALFMQAESLFFADQLIDASDVYQKLQKDFPRNRHGDRVAARLFSITQYWIDTEKATTGSRLPINLFDSTRPRMDVDGHAVRILDQIRYDDPTGRLADDATMAAAAEYIRQEDYQMADEFLTDLRETYPESDYFFLAHMMGIQCKLELYAGPRYTNLLLEEADQLIAKTRQRFPDRLQDEKYSQMLARASSEVAYLRAEHLFERAAYREKRREFRAAATFYQEVLNQFSDTPFADRAREGLERTAEKPAVPTRRLSWLKTIFPDQKVKSPLELNFTSPSGESRETVLR
ncbi:MAG: tetratricopeptide repeat protein [Planctomycetota bacterium]